MEQTVLLPRLRAQPPVDPLVNDRLTMLRFAVATFDAESGLREALVGLRLEGLRDDAFNCLALDEVLARAMTIATLPQSKRHELAFSGQLRPISCTAGVLADCLDERLHAGAPTLKAALGEWLIPRHAGQIQDAVEQGKIVLWVRPLDSEEEALACRSLLALSSYSVGVHDLVARRLRPAP